LKCPSVPTKTAKGDIIEKWEYNNNMHSESTSSETEIDQQKQDKLERWINDIIKEILQLLATRQTITSFIKIIQQKQEESADLVTAIKYSYVSAIVLAICRQTDYDPNARSIARLLREMIWDKDAVNDLCALLHQTKELRAYRDKRIAHRDKGGYDIKQTFNDANSAIEMIKDLAEKYYLKLTKSSIELKPLVDEEWHSLLTIPLPAETASNSIDLSSPSTHLSQDASISS
jgi:hypothetical protein